VWPHVDGALHATAFGRRAAHCHDDDVDNGTKAAAAATLQAEAKLREHVACGKNTVAG
jgi:hypothetical protein